MFGNTIGPWEIGLILLIALVVFGPKKLPELGKGLGRGMRDFKRAVTGDDEDERKAEDEAHKAAEIAKPVVVEAPVVVVEQAPVVVEPVATPAAAPTATAPAANDTSS